MKTKDKKKNGNKGSNAASLEKSHDLWSNTKLTFISFLAALGFAGIFAFLGLRGIIPDVIFYSGTIGCAALTVLTICLFTRFKR